MVVDDSAVIRGFFRRALETDPELEVVASVANGQAVVDAQKCNPLEVIVFDIEMPILDGLPAIPNLFPIDPGVRIIMASTLTLANAEIRLMALSIGATDYIPKPPTAADIHSSEWFGRELVEKVKGMSLSACRNAVQAPRAEEKAGQGQQKTALYTSPVTLRAPAMLRAQVVAIGSSTGGPQSLMKVLEQLGANFPLPILVSQHMPATLTGILAGHASNASCPPTDEGRGG